MTSNLSPVRRLTSAERADERGTVLTVGVFDGVHRGHQALIGHVVNVAQVEGLASAVVTFDPHPAETLNPERAPLRLETLERRLERFAALGVDQVLVVPFDDAASKEEAVSFVDRVLVEQMRARRVVVGDDFRFGHDREGDAVALERWGVSRGFATEAVGPVGGRRRISSSRAREAIAAGDLVTAESVLGHRVSVTGTVVRGDGRGGKDLGFPTANLAVPDRDARLGAGIYAAAARRKSGAYVPSAVSIGRRPQFYDDAPELIEAHLIEFHGDLYGETIELVFFEKLRDEMAFSSVEELIAQIERDVEHSAAIGQQLSPLTDELLGFLPVQRR